MQSRFGVTVAVLCTAAVLFASVPVVPAVYAANVLTPADIAELQSRGIRAATPANYDVTGLAGMVAAVEQGMPVQLNVLGVPRTLMLSWNPAFDQEILAENPGVYPLAGHVVGDSASRVRLTVDVPAARLDGMVQTGDGARVYVEPVYENGAPVHAWYASANARVTLPAHAHIPGVDDALNVPAPLNVPDGREGPSADGNTTAYEALDVATGTYNSVWFRVYYDSGTNPTSVMNVAEDIFNAETGMAFRIVSVQSISTTGWPNEDCTTTGSAPFLARFRSTYPLNGNDRSILFTNNNNINYGTVIGCAYVPGSHSWVKWAGSTKQKEVVTAHEVGHNFNAAHDDVTTIEHCHYYWGWCWDNHNHSTIMRGSYQGDSNVDATFSQTSRNSITPYGDNMPRKMKVWVGSEVSSHGVKLTRFEVHYLRNGATVGSQITVKNTWSANTGTVALQNAFVGARNAADANRDFGHLGAVTLTTSARTDTFTYTVPNEKGTWTVWPAYQFSGQWGPYKWKSQTFSVV